jgi:small-conductance mechanosensitive channel
MNNFKTVGSDGQVVYDIIGIVITIVVAVIVAIVLLAILKKVFTPFKVTTKNDIPKEKKTMMRIVYSVLKFIIILFTFLAVLSLLGVDITGAVAGLGIAGAIGGLAVQDMLKDFIQGINIATAKFFSIGDVINYNGYRGKVIELTMRNTKLKSIDDGSIRTIGNSKLVDVVKMSNSVSVTVSLSYDADMKYVYKVLSDIAEEAKKFDNIEECSFLGTQNFSESSIDYIISATCTSPEATLPGRRQLLGLLQERLAEAGLEIPYRQLDINTR